MWSRIHGRQKPAAGGGTWLLRSDSHFVSFQWSVLQIQTNLIQASGSVQPQDNWRKSEKPTLGRTAQFKGNTGSHPNHREKVLRMHPPPHVKSSWATWDSGPGAVACSSADDHQRSDVAPDLGLEG